MRESLRRRILLPQIFQFRDGFRVLPKLQQFARGGVFPVYCGGVALRWRPRAAALRCRAGRSHLKQTTKHGNCREHTTNPHGDLPSMVSPRFKHNSPGRVDPRKLLANAPIGQENATRGTLAWCASEKFSNQ